jgi:hypothetical protein
MLKYTDITQKHVCPKLQSLGRVHVEFQTTHQVSNESKKMDNSVHQRALF